MKLSCQENRIRYSNFGEINIYKIFIKKIKSTKFRKTLPIRYMPELRFRVKNTIEFYFNYYSTNYKWKNLTHILIKNILRHGQCDKKFKLPVKW